MLVTGAAGNVGVGVVRGLLARGLPVRAADLDLRVLGDRAPGAAAVHLDLTDPKTFAPALRGVRRVFLIRPPAIARVGPTLNRFLDVAVAEGVEHVVFSSVAGAETNRVVPHHRVERHLMASGLGWTMLRPGFFAQNLATAYRQDVVRDARVHVPAGLGRVAFIDVRDLGEVAALVLADPAPHRGVGYTLTGPEAITFYDVAAVLTKELGRPVRYEPASILGYVRHLGRQGLPMPQRLVQTVLHAGLRRGDAETVDPTLERLLDRRPHTLAEYVRDHRDLWEPTKPARD